MQQTTDVKELVNDLFAAGAHIGFVRSRRHPSVAKYLHSTRSRKDIINLETTAPLLATAEEFAMTLGRLGKTLLFVGTKPEVKEIVREAAVSVEQPYVTERWLGGTLTNLAEIKKRTKRYTTLRDQRDAETLVYKTKKEKLMLERELARLERNFKGISTMDQLPDALFVVDPKHEHIAVAEARQLGIPVIALANTDCDISLTRYPVVANDTMSTSVAHIVKRVRNAFKSGKTASVTYTWQVSFPLFISLCVRLQILPYEQRRY